LKKLNTLLLLNLTLALTFSSLSAGTYYALCEGNYGQANASLWSMDESLQSVNGPLIWNASSNPLGDVGQSLTLFDHTLYIIMNGSHEVRVVDLESGADHVSDIEIPDSSPRYMAIHRQTGLGYISSWNLGALLVFDVETKTLVDTLYLGNLPEQILINGDEMFVTVPLRSDWSPANKVLRLDLSGTAPEVTHTYDVIEGPGAMVLLDDELYVTSLYYNDAWETFTGTSKINLDDHSVESLDHGLYTNFTADLEIIEGAVYRTFGNSLVPLNEDLSLDLESGLADIGGIYSHAVLNQHILFGSSDFVAPDLITVCDMNGQASANLNVGALPSHIVYYDPDVVSTDKIQNIPGTLFLGHNFPNPFNPETIIPFRLEKDGTISLNIYDIRGRLVSTLINGSFSRGAYEANWDGRNMNGIRANSGIYHAILRAGHETRSIKINLIK